MGKIKVVQIQSDYVVFKQKPLSDTHGDTVTREGSATLAHFLGLIDFLFGPLPICIYNKPFLLLILLSHMKKEKKNEMSDFRKYFSWL